MDRKEQIEAMTRFNGGKSYIKRKKVAEHLDYKDPHCVDKFLSGLERIGTAYFVPDVVDSIRAQRNYR